MIFDWEPLPSGEWVKGHGIIVPGDPNAPEGNLWNRPFEKYRWRQAAILKVSGAGRSLGYHIGYINRRDEPWYCTQKLTSPRVALPIGREPRHFFAVNARVIGDEIPLALEHIWPIRKVKHYRNTALVRY